MEKNKEPVVKRSLFSWVLPGNVRLQVISVMAISVAVVARVLPLEMQKRIVDEAIALQKLDLLYLYGGLWLGAVLLANGLKFLINYLQTYISQNALSSMRKELYHHVLRLPLNFFRRTPPGMVVSSLVNELSSCGDFVGAAIAIPLINLFTLILFAVYLINLNWLLAIVSLSIYPLVLVIIPLLQRRVNEANKKRVDVTRAMSNRITETLSGIHEVHGNGSYRIENKKFDRLVDKLFRIRIVWTLYKQAVNLTNNFFNNMSPWLIGLLGGYLAMTGKLQLGALLAFWSAQERLYSPWKELIAFYQLYQDATVRYSRTMEYFDVVIETELKPEEREPYQLEGGFEIKNLSFVTEDGIRLLDSVSLSLEPGEHMALVGFSGSGKSTLAQCIGQLYKYTGGHVLIGNQEVAELTKADIVNNIGIVAQAPFIFDGTIEENLLYACAALADRDGENEAGTLPNLDEMIEVLQQTGVFADVLRFGLNAILNSEQHADLVSRLVRVRKNFQQYFGDELAEYVEFFDEDHYLHHSSVAENLVFGAPTGESFREEDFAQNERFLAFLNEADLSRPLLSLGAELSKQTVDILGNLPPDKVFFDQSPFSPEEIDEYKMLVERLKKKRLHQLGEKDREMLLALALRFIPGRHKMVGLPGMLENLILEGRALFRELISKEDPEAVSFFHMSDYIYSQTILNNILFGKTKTSRTAAQDKIYQSIIQLLIEEELLETIVSIGMQFEVGTKGDRLSGGQRQKLAIARAFLKAPRILIMDEATSALDNKSQARVQNQLTNRWQGKTTLIAVVHRLDITKTYDKVAVMKAGKIVEIGTYEELIAKEGMLYELAIGQK